MSSRLNDRQKKLIVTGLALILLALVAKQFVLKKSVPASIAVSAPVHRVVDRPHAAATRPARLQIDSSLPAALRSQLERHPVVVAALYATGQDADALAAARAGAAGSHAGFAALDVDSESIAQAIALKAPGTPDPSVLVVTRPGTIAVLLPGYADPDAVAAAVENAR